MPRYFLASIGAATLGGVIVATAACSASRPAGVAPAAKPGPVRSGPPFPASTPTELRPSPQDRSAGTELVKRLIGALGGESVVDRVRGIQLVGSVERRVANGETQVDTVETWIRFPDRYRQKLTLPIGDLVTVVGPEGSFFITPQGAVSLPEAQRFDIERAVMRNLVAMVKTRGNELFLATGSRGEKLDGRSMDRLVIRIADEATTLWMDPETGYPRREEYESMSSSGERLPKVTLDLSDYRTVEGLAYPFSTTANVAGKPSYSSRLERLIVNGAMDDSLFRPPGDVPPLHP